MERKHRRNYTCKSREKNVNYITYFVITNINYSAPTSRPLSLFVYLDTELKATQKISRKGTNCDNLSNENVLVNTNIIDNQKEVNNF